MDISSETHHEMSSLLVVVKSHLFPQLVQLNREIGTSRDHCMGRWRVCGCQSRVGGHDTRELHGAAAVESIAMDGYSVFTYLLTQQLLTTLTHNRYLVEAPG